MTSDPWGLSEDDSPVDWCRSESVDVPADEELTERDDCEVLDKQYSGR